MKSETLYDKSLFYLNKFCQEIAERCVGSEGNRQATAFFEKEIALYGWQTEMPHFEAIDWEEGEARLTVDGQNHLAFDVLVSPYSLGCTVTAPLVSVSTVEALEQLDITEKIILLHDEIAKEQLMPKNFVFYNPESHQKIIALLEAKKPKAIITATGRNAALAGGIYPFPLIEDGDFDIPSVYMTEEEGKKLLAYTGCTVNLNSISKRIRGKGYNVIAKKGINKTGRIVVTAHIDAKKGTPGAIDNATGVIILLLLANLLQDYEGDPLIEIVAFNGEDYFSAPGQMNYISQNQGNFDDVLLNINIDGAGYKKGPSAFSLFGLPNPLEKRVYQLLDKFEGITEGVQWIQSDHGIFIQYGRPAIAVSSKWFIDNVDAQDITHTPKDNVEIVDCNKVVEIAQALALLLL